MVIQVILLQVELCQAGTGTEHRDQVLAAAGCETTALQTVGAMHMVIALSACSSW